MEPDQTILNDAELLKNEDDRALTSLAQRNSNPKLMALRAQMPFINIMPFPTKALAFKLLAGVAQDIALPQGTKLIRFSSGGTYYASRMTAQLPVAGSGEAIETGSMQTPADEWWYVEDVTSISMVAVADTDVTIACFIQL
jgi:hypothetical protein